MDAFSFPDISWSWVHQHFLQMVVDTELTNYKNRCEISSYIINKNM